MISMINVPLCKHTEFWMTTKIASRFLRLSSDLSLYTLMSPHIVKFSSPPPPSKNLDSETENETCILPLLFNSLSGCETGEEPFRETNYNEVASLPAGSGAGGACSV